MSFSNAIHQREEMNKAYKKLLLSETSADRIAAINDQIDLNLQEIAQLKEGKPLFGRPKPLKQTTTTIERDPENPKEAKITVVDNLTPSTPTPTTPSTRLANKLRDSFKPKVATSTENSLKAQIAAAKAAKKA